MFEKQAIYMLFKLFQNRQKDGTCSKSFTKPIQQNGKMMKNFQSKDEPPLWNRAQWRQPRFESGLSNSSGLFPQKHSCFICMTVINKTIKPNNNATLYALKIKEIDDDNAYIGFFPSNVLRPSYTFILNLSNAHVWTVMPKSMKPSQSQQGDQVPYVKA